jgi:hypothetical protein
MSNTDIAKALFERVETLNLSLPIAYPNVTFNKPKNRRYLEVLFFPNVPVDYAWSEGHFDRGLLQLNVYWTADLGIIPALTAADTIAAHFVKGTVLEFGTVKVLIDAPPSIAANIQNGDAKYITVRISYKTTN